jgi:hypothetical protein
MVLANRVAALIVVVMLVLLTGPVDAARVKQKNSHTVTGKVMSKTSGVSGAHVHVMHHHKSRTTTSTGAKAATTTKRATTAKPKATRTHKATGTMTGSNGSFRLTHRHSGSITLVAHKKGVGSGHATVASSANAKNVVISLHKHHHHHA